MVILIFCGHSEHAHFILLVASFLCLVLFFRFPAQVLGTAFVPDYGFPAHVLGTTLVHDYGFPAQVLGTTLVAD